MSTVLTLVPSHAPVKNFKQAKLHAVKICDKPERPEVATAIVYCMIQCDRLLAVGTELSFQVNYGALLRAMTSPFIEKKYTRTQHLDLQQEETIMSKGKNQKKNVKKKPLLTAKEKKAAKAAKKATTDFLSS